MNIRENVMSPNYSNATCRICLLTNNSYFFYNINFCVTLKDNVITLGEMIKKYTSIEICKGDQKPQNICENCASQLCQSYNFLEMCIAAENHLNKVFKDKLCNVTVNKEPKTESNIPNVKIETEINENVILSNNETFGNVTDEDNSEDIFDTVINDPLKIQKITKNKLKKKSTKKKTVDNDDKFTNTVDEQKNFQCTLCQEEMKNFDSVLAHFENLHLNDKNCILCKKYFRREYFMRFHLKKHNKVNYVCGRCHVAYNSMEELKTHLQSFQHLYPKSCQICGKRFNKKAFLRNHMRSHRGAKDFQCNLCGKCFTYKQNLGRHLEAHRGPRFLCSVCGKSFKTHYDMKRHSQVEHEGLTENGEKSTTVDSVTKTKKVIVNKGIFEYCCEICGKVFRSYMAKRAYKIHLESHPEFCDYTCEICKQPFDNKAALRDHINVVHNKYKCQHCDRTFRWKCSLESHYAVHKEEPRYQVRCPECGITLKSKLTLTTHMRIHTGEKPYSCTLCGKKFRQDGHLRNHMFFHLKNKPHKCQTCGKAFSVPAELRSHERIHTGERPFPCPYCDKAFRDSTCLLKHKRKKHALLIEEAKLKDGVDASTSKEGNRENSSKKT